MTEEQLRAFKIVQKELTLFNDSEVKERKAEGGEEVPEGAQEPEGVQEPERALEPEGAQETVAEVVAAEIEQDS